jgi:hypothetical protein
MTFASTTSLLASVALHETAFNWAFLLSQLGMGR